MRKKVFINAVLSVNSISIYTHEIEKLLPPGEKFRKEVYEPENHHFLKDIG
jgi:hypothetical protein